MEILSRHHATWTGFNNGGYYSREWDEENVCSLFQFLSLKEGEEVGIYVDPNHQTPHWYEKQFEWVRKYGGVPVFVFYWGWLKPDDEATFRDRFDTEPLYGGYVKILDLEEWQRLGGPWYG